MSTNNLNWTIEYYEENRDKCKSILNLPENYEKVPCINSLPLQNCMDETLVKYRGMVQDMLNPEYYSSSYTVVDKQTNQSYVKSGKFRDITFCKANEEFKDNESNIHPEERLVFFCIPIPGTNSWVENYNKEKFTAESTVSKCSGSKRRSSDDEMETDVVQGLDSVSLLNSKKNKVEDHESKISSESSTYSNDKYFPFNKQSGIPCIVKVYEEEGKADLVLNERIEVIGFLSLNPALEANWENTDSEDKALHPPPSLVPRIHTISIKKLKHCNPLMNQTVPYDGISELAESARSDLHLILTQMLFEDTVAADYLLCHLLSKVYIRRDDLTIGKFSLNLFNIKDKTFASLFYDILKTLVTNSYFLPLSIKFLNESTFVPKKDYESNRLWSGILQLCDDTHLVLDETNMDEGQLKNEGCCNVIALQKMFREQQVNYDFGYYPVSYDTNIPLLVLSEGKSMFEADIRVNIKTDGITNANISESFEAVRLYLNEEVSNKIRRYLTSVRLMDFDLGEEMMKKIGEDYVSLRQEERTVSAFDLHTLLVLSRLLALSRGRSVMTSEDWNRAVEMETERKLRLR